MSLHTSDYKLKERVELEVKNEMMRKAVAMAQDTIGANRQKMVDDLGNFEAWRDLAMQYRNHVLENLDAYLYQLSEKVTQNGGHVFFAATAEEASQYVLKVCQEKKAKKVVKSKSMVTEEIGVNHVLEANGIKTVETDLAEYILQLSGDKPSHIVVPAIHKDRHAIRADLEKYAGYKGTAEPSEMTAFIRNELRPDFLTADVGISGCNFAVAETGSACLVTNEGNMRLATSLPKTHIAVMGMERILPSFKEVDVLITMLARSAVGAKLTGYNTWLTGPRLNGETDGPEDFHLVIVDNGRSKALASPEFREVLRCIRCGACMNTCPAYREIGGHGYGSIYPGPIGVVISPLIGGYEEFKELPGVCTLCTGCNSVCPVRIPLAQLISKHRENLVKLGYEPFIEKLETRFFTLNNNNPALWNLTVKTGAVAAGLAIRNGHSLLEVGPVAAWTEARDLPKPYGQSFRSWFKAQEKIKHQTK